MKRRFKDVILILSLMTAMLIAAGAVASAETVDEGTLGDDIVWTLDDEGTLTIQLAEGVESAATPDYSYSNHSPFYNNSDIKSVIIGEGITKVGDYLFVGLTGLKSVDLPEGLTSIGGSAFYMSGIRSMEMPDSVTEMGGGVFEQCSYLKSVKLSSGITEIPVYAFAACYRLKTVEIPDGVKLIREDAFIDCTELREMIIPASVEKIEIRTFLDCISLEKITFKGDFCVEMGAFYLCNLTAYYPLHNSTWDEDAIDTGYGGKVKWIGYCDDPKPAAAVKEKIKQATALATGSYESVVYCSVCGKEISRTPKTIAKLKPTIKLSATKKTLKKKKSYTLKVTGLAKGDAVKSFKTSKKTVATVTSKGKITAKKKGKATITVTLKSGKTAACKVTVK